MTGNQTTNYRLTRHENSDKSFALFIFLGEKSAEIRFTSSIISENSVVCRYIRAEDPAHRIPSCRDPRDWNLHYGMPGLAKNATRVNIRGIDN